MKSETYKCQNCTMRFRVHKKLSKAVEDLKCSECERPFWSVAPNKRHSNKSIVGIDPANIDEFGHWV